MQQISFNGGADIPEILILWQLRKTIRGLKSSGKASKVVLCWQLWYFLPPCPLLHKLLQLHSLHKADLKFIGKTEELQKQKQRYRTYGGDIHMEFGLTSVQRLYLQGADKLISS